MIKPRTLSIIAGISYLVIFFAAIFANFFVIESILKDPLVTIQMNQVIVRFGIKIQRTPFIFLTYIQDGKI